MRVPGGPARFHRTRYILAASILAALAVASSTGFAWASKSVDLIVDGKRSTLTTRASDVASMLQEAGVRVSAGDLVAPSRSSDVDDGGVIVVRHAVNVTLSLAGETRRVRVLGRTVGDALTAAGLDPTSGMSTDPAIDEPIYDGLHIEAVDVFVRVIQQEVEVPCNTIVQGDPAARAGSRRVVTAGAPGRALRVFRVLMSGGSEAARSLSSETVLAPAVDELVVVGTKQPFRQVVKPRANVKSAPDLTGRTIRVVTTAYTPWDPSCLGHDDIARGFKWVAGKRRQYHIPDGWGIIAIDPRVVPTGSKLLVDGYGYAIACDTGGAIKGNKIDVCFWGADSNASTSPADMPAQVRQARNAAYQWGARYRKSSISLTILGK